MTEVIHERDNAPSGMRVARPVLWWGALGAGFAGLEAYVFTRWVFGEHFERVPTGPTPVPAWTKLVVHGMEVVSVAAMVVALYWFIYRPWRATGRLGVDAVFLIAFSTMIWQNQLFNFLQVQCLFNAESFNRGSWYGYIPGWRSPNPEMIVEPLWLFPFSLWGNYLLALAGAKVLARARKRWPTLGKPGLLGVCLVFFLLLYGLSEALTMAGQLHVMPGVVNGWTFYGGAAQDPIHEWVLFSIVLTAWAATRYFLDDRGHSPVEHGIDRVNVGPRAKFGLRVLAVGGAINVIFLLGYSLPAGVMALYSDSWPAEVLERSYMLHGVCGPGTDYACPGPDVPVARRGFAHIDTTGRLVAGTP